VELIDYYWAVLWCWGYLDRVLALGKDAGEKCK